MEEKKRNEVTDWGRKPKNTSCKFLPSAWFTYHSGPVKTARGFISNPAQAQSGCWEVAEVSMASKDFHKECSDLAEIFGSFGNGLVLWKMHRAEISGRFFFLLRPLLYISPWILYQSLHWLSYKCMLRRKLKLRGAPPKYVWILILIKYCTWKPSLPYQQTDH